MASNTLRHRYFNNLFLCHTPTLYDVKHPTSLLFIARVRTFRPNNGLLIAIYSTVLPNVQRSRPLSQDNVAKGRHPRQIQV